jgi:alanine-glyoxylate transaminase / serine-glyoxylate transaminase / serine-pyruvate transaminase
MSPTKLPPITDFYRRRTMQLNVPSRLLLGAGPANLHPRVLQALSTQLISHLDPSFISLIEETQDLFRYLWQTKNELVLAISGTGAAAMEAAIANVVEPGDVVLVGVNGYFGSRIAETATRYGADVRSIQKPWGEVFALEELRSALELNRPVLLALVHGETSTGVEQPLVGIGGLCREYDALFMVDSVASLGGVPLYVDAWGIDVCYSAGQNCLGAPPGISPLTMNHRAMDKIHSRKTPVQSLYFDVTMLAEYWGSQHRYHHTIPINLIYALRESLRLIIEEGIAECWQRHRNNAELLWMGLAEMELDCYVRPGIRLPGVTTIQVPPKVNARAVARYLLTDYNLEIGVGIEHMAEEVWRVGLMGFNSRAENVTLFLRTFEDALLRSR